jgi:hypothetical protein
MTRERTRDIYEQNPAYPRPPLIPLPEPGNLDSLTHMGVRLTPFSRRLILGAMRLIGFDAFLRELPERLEELLRTTEMRGAYLFGPVISAVLSIDDDPRNLPALTRAATLLVAARELHLDITSGTLPSDRYREEALEMGQYPNLFSTCLIVEGKRARVFKSDNRADIAVAVARRLYIQHLGDPESGLDVTNLEAALGALVQRADQNRLGNDDAPAGLLTCADHWTQIRSIGRLQRDPVNAASLEALRHTFLTLCLDLDNEPTSHAEAAAMAFSRNCANRWYHSSLQIVVFGNGKACLICNFSAYLDGNVMMRGGAELQQRAARCAVDAVPIETGLPPARELTWHIKRELIDQARTDLKRVLDNQQSIFEIPRFGAGFFSDHDLAPVPTFILALQMALYKLSGKALPITQFLAMSRYRCMDLQTAMVTTPEVIRFVEFALGKSSDHEDGPSLLSKAVESQVVACREARRYLDLETIIGMYMLSNKGLARWWRERILQGAILLLGLFGLMRPQRRQVLVSHPTIYPQVPLVGRPGVRLPYLEHLGLHYQILAKRIVITLMPSLTWQVPNAEVVAEIRAALESIQAVLEGASRLSSD